MDNSILLVLVAIVANLVYQLVILFNEYERTEKLPWDERPRPRGAIMFILATLFKPLVAGCVVWGLTHEGQVGGIIAAAIIGMASEEIVINLAAAGRKVAKELHA